jgi:hypothetical protein
MANGKNTSSNSNRLLFSITRKYVEEKTRYPFFNSNAKKITYSNSNKVLIWEIIPNFPFRNAKIRIYFVKKKLSVFNSFVTLLNNWCCFHNVLLYQIHFSSKIREISWKRIKQFFVPSTFLQHSLFVSIVQYQNTMFCTFGLKQVFKFWPRTYQEHKVKLGCNELYGAVKIQVDLVICSRYILLFWTANTEFADRRHLLTRNLAFLSIFQLWISEFVDKKTADNEVHLYVLHSRERLYNKITTWNK